jgi:predicted nucleic acid-binding protein
MRLVLDTNVFISAFYWGGNPQGIIHRIIEGIDELYISDEILYEVATIFCSHCIKSESLTSTVGIGASPHHLSA